MIVRCRRQEWPKMVSRGGTVASADSRRGHGDGGGWRGKGGARWDAITAGLRHLGHTGAPEGIASRRLHGSRVLEPTFDRLSCRHQTSRGYPSEEGGETRPQRGVRRKIGLQVPRVAHPQTDKPEDPAREHECRLQNFAVVRAWHFLQSSDISIPRTRHLYVFVDLGRLKIASSPLAQEM